jgi:hypothetical protein
VASDEQELFTCHLPLVTVFNRGAEKNWRNNSMS